SRTAEEFAPHGRVVEELAHLDAGTGSAVPGARRTQDPAVTGDFLSVGLIRWSGLQRDLGHAADGGESFAAEAKRGDAKQVLGIAQFAGGMTGEGQRQILCQDAAAVVNHPNAVGTALINFYLDAPAAGIQGVFQEFLDDAGGTLDDFARSDLRDDQRRK